MNGQTCIVLRAIATIRGCAAIIAVFLLAQTSQAGPDLSGTVLVLDETFSEGLSRYDGVNGVWSTLPRRGQLMTNADEAVFIDSELVSGMLPEVHALTEEGLALRSVELPDTLLAEVSDYMRLRGQGNRAGRIRYGSGMISTAQTWAQTYGYFEIEARIPRGRGRWPAFWLTFAGLGWPPEIDVFEAYGTGIGKPTNKDDTFNTAVHFDAIDAQRAKSHNTDIENPFATDAEGRAPDVRPNGATERYAFRRTHNARLTLGSDIYSEFHTYAVFWTPETISFFFGPDRDNLLEIFRAPTPEDARDPMYVIANDQFTARGGWWSPRAETLDEVLDPENNFAIRRIIIRALKPARSLTASRAFNSAESTILDTAGDDEIAPGSGFDLIELSSGSDTLMLTRGRDGKIISGFGADDHLVLEGYPFTAAHDVARRLTQVGRDVWLPSGGDPGWPQTIVFRDVQIAEFSPAQFTVRWPVARDIWAADASRARVARGDDEQRGTLTALDEGSWITDRGTQLRIIGGPATDRYRVSHPRTTISEAKDGGIDTIIAATNLTMPEYVEHAIAIKRGITLRGTQNDDRLEAVASGVTLDGQRGDDLFVIDVDAEATRVILDLDFGHDRLRGFKASDFLVLTARLRQSQANWRMSRAPDGTLIQFGPDHSLTFEGIALREVAARLGIPVR